VSFPFDLHSAAVSDSHLPCHAHAAPMPCSDHAVLVKATAQHGMASVNQTRPHCVSQMGKTHSKPLAARHEHGMLCVNRPLGIKVSEHRYWHSAGLVTGTFARSLIFRSLPTTSEHRLRISIQS